MNAVLRLLVGIGYILDGLVILLTIGLLENRPESFALRAARIKAKYNLEKEGK